MQLSPATDELNLSFNNIRKHQLLLYVIILDILIANDTLNNVALYFFFVLLDCLLAFTLNSHRFYYVVVKWRVGLSETCRKSKLVVLEITSGLFRFQKNYVVVKNRPTEPKSQFE